MQSYNPGIDRLIKRVIAASISSATTEELLSQERDNEVAYYKNYNTFYSELAKTVKGLKSYLEYNNIIPETEKIQLREKISRLENIEKNPIPIKSCVVQNNNMFFDSEIILCDDLSIQDACNYFSIQIHSLQQQERNIQILNPDIRLTINAVYFEISQFLSEECANVLDFLCKNATKILPNEDDTGYLDNYNQLIDTIKNNITIQDKLNQVIIAKFDRKEASRQWNNTRVKKAELANLKILQNANPGLISKILSDRSTNNHQLMNDEIESVIRYLGYDDKIFVCTLEKKSLTDTINKAYNTNIRDGQFYIILNNTRNIENQGSHWTSAKVTVNEINVILEYADSGKSGSTSSIELKNTLSDIFNPKMITEQEQDNPLATQLSFFECGYLAIFNCLRDIDGLSQIGGWNNDAKNISTLVYWIQKFALLGYRFKENDTNFTNLRDKSKILKHDESDAEKAYQFEPSFIENKLKPKIVKFPFYMLIKESVDELNEYLTDRENSISYQNGWKKEGYATRITKAYHFVAALSAASRNEDLKLILEGSTQHSIGMGITQYREFLNHDNCSSKLSKILEGIEHRIKARMKIKVDINDVENLYKQALLVFKTRGTHLEVTPSEYSWYGNELISKELNRKTTTKYHTVVDELIGKLYLTKNDTNMDEQTKCTDMQILINQTRKAIIKSLQTEESETNDMPYPDKYNEIWDDIFNNHPVKRALKLLEDYVDAGGWGLFCSLHWKRHHTPLVKNSMLIFRKIIDGLTIEDIFTHFSRQLDCDTTNPSGSLIKRLKYIAMRTDIPFYLYLQDDAHSLKSSDKLQFRSTSFGKQVKNL